MKNVTQKIINAKSIHDIAGIMDDYLIGIGQAELSRGESYQETADRLAEDPDMADESSVCELAERRWWEVQ